MLKYLRIKNIAVVAEAAIEFGPGLNLLTGETGAGKSILVDALGLLSGDRATSDVVRSGEQAAVVEGLFETPGLEGELDARGLPRDGESIVVRRELAATGKGRATVNGALVPVSVLRDLLPRVLEIHGQHDQRGLLDPVGHLEILDRHAGLAAAREELKRAHGELARLDRELQELRGDRREIERRREMLEFQAKEIEAAGLDAQEEDALRREKVIQSHAGRLAGLTEEAYGLLYEDEAAVLSRLGTAFRRVEELAEVDPGFRPFVEARAGVRATLEDLSYALRDFRQKLAVSPGRIDEIEERLAVVERLKRKYGSSLEEVIAFGARCRAEAAALGSPETRLAELEGERAGSAARFRELAVQVSRKRRAAAAGLERKVGAELGELAMEKASFRAAFEPATIRPDDESTWTALGLEGMEFLLSANAGEEARPLARVASGGELSRVLLALESVAAASGRPATLVFDEVDSGIGGRVAEVVGRRLHGLSQRHQVLCVTHLPQIAALADRHFAVRKRVERGRTHTDVADLGTAERVEEIARMLAGETVTESARRHARELVKAGRDS
ncbi:MAG: DNA repair protein RecN [Vicinamibacteria bacterium]